MAALDFTPINYVVIIAVIIHEIGESSRGGNDNGQSTDNWCSRFCGESSG